MEIGWPEGVVADLGSTDLYTGSKDVFSEGFTF